MKQEMLKGLAKQLHEGLRQTDDIDNETRRLLQSLNQDIENALRQEEPPDDPIYAAISERAKAIYAGFATRHPKLEPTLRELGNMLEKIGV
ncbi:MAG: DUF4404 family protein [Burkholderiales bacterium]|nr:DUF4404 family protein [Burkholderiales bacterium]